MGSSLLNAQQPVTVQLAARHQPGRRAPMSVCGKLPDGDDRGRPARLVQRCREPARVPDDSNTASAAVSPGGRPRLRRSATEPAGDLERRGSTSATGHEGGPKCSATAATSSPIGPAPTTSTEASRTAGRRHRRSTACQATLVARPAPPGAATARPAAEPVAAPRTTSCVVKPPSVCGHCAALPR